MIILGQENKSYSWIWIYKILLITWIMFGLGYLLMILGFIQKLIKSDRLHKLPGGAAKALVSAGYKLGTGINKEVSDLRKLVNTIHLNKLKVS